MKKILAIVLTGLCSLATTYVIEENGVEVGSWEENDGRDEVKKISAEAPKPGPKPLPAGRPIMDGPGYQWEPGQTQPGETSVWKVSGRVIDIVRLQPVLGAVVVFLGGAEPVRVPVKAEGAFSARLPQLERGAYMISVEAPGYEPMPHVLTSGSFYDLAYERRLRLRGSVSFGGDLGGHALDMQIGLYPLSLTPAEEDAYRKSLLSPGQGEA